MTLTVEFDTGTTISEAFSKSTELAKKLNLNVKFMFNSIECVSYSSGNPEKGIKNYHLACKKKSLIKNFATNI